MHTTEVGAMVGTPLGTAVGMLVGAVGSQQGLVRSSLLEWPVTNEQYNTNIRFLIIM